MFLFWAPTTLGVISTAVSVVAAAAWTTITAQGAHAVIETTRRGLYFGALSRGDC